ncbi:hypothetical protein CRG98_032163, partial [Punica granatum]
PGHRARGKVEVPSRSKVQLSESSAAEQRNPALGVNRVWLRRGPRGEEDVGRKVESCRSPSRKYRRRWLAAVCSRGIERDRIRERRERERQD